MKTYEDITMNLTDGSEKEKRIKLLNMTPEEKELYVERLLISAPNINKILSQMDECLNTSKVFREPKCMFISGGSRYGKTTIAEVFHNRYPDIHNDAGTIKPIIHLKVPSPAYTGNLKSKLLETIGDPFYDKILNNQQSDARINKLLDKCKVKMIILDEFQHLIDSKRHKVQMDTSDWFKNLISERQISVAFIGMPHSVNILTENEQLGNRVTYRHDLKPFKYGSKEFRVFLTCFDNQLPLEKTSNLAEPGTWERIHLATGGVIGFIKLLISEGVKIASTNNISCINNDILFEAYNNRLLFTSEENPFDPSFNLGKKIKHLYGKL